MKTLYIFNRDLRLKENKALSMASKSDEISFSYLKPNDLDNMSEARGKFLIESIKALSESLNELGHKFYLFEEKPLEGIDRVVVSKVYNTKDEKIIHSIENWAKTNKKEFIVVENSTLYHTKDLPFSVENLPGGFSSFRKKIEKNDLEFNSAGEVESPSAFDLDLEEVSVLYSKYENVEGNKNFKGGESEGLNRLHTYLWENERAKTYKDTRNGMVEFDDSTKFSPWLALGCISPITVMNELHEFEEKIEKNESTYWIYFELLWREYFKIYSLKYGDKIFEVNGLGKKVFRIEDHDDPKQLYDEWCNGNTREPFVNANMMELLKTGWMSNRGRQNVASYLSKHLCLDWTWGAEWFETHLIDFDIESNWGNWNYNAGVGTDPRDRIFNIKKQAEMYDPLGEYKSTWIN